MIHKHNAPMVVTNYKPIFVCNVNYKILSKLLLNHLKKVIYNIIGLEQCCFLVGRSYVDNIIVIQEVVHSIENDTQRPLGWTSIWKKLTIKIEWNVILDTLLKMYFLEQWISGIKACVSTTGFSFSINDHPSGLVHVGVLVKGTLYRHLTFLFELPKISLLC